MSRRVFKYALVVGDQVLDLPRGAVIRMVDHQGGNLCLWAEVDPDAEIEGRIFRVYGTGHEIADDLEYVGSSQDTLFVWHVYERTTEQ